MSDFIENFYYGNIEPQQESNRLNSAIRKEMQILAATEESLTNNLTGERKLEFLDYVNAWSVVNAETNLDNFINGFRLGAKFVLDVFAEE